MKLQKREHIKYSFTLIEIIVVITIIIILIVLAVPAGKAIREQAGYADAVNTLNAALQAARSYAVMNNLITAARFERFDEDRPEQRRKVQLAYDNNSDGDYEDEEDIISSVKPLYFPLQYTVDNNPTPTTDGGYFYVEYNPQGRIVGKDITIYLFNVVDNAPDPNSRKTFHINYYTGRLISPVR